MGLGDAHRTDALSLKRGQGHVDNAQRCNMSTASMSRSDSMQQPLMSGVHGSPRHSNPEHRGRPPLSHLGSIVPKTMHEAPVPAATNPLVNERWDGNPVWDGSHQRDQGKLWTPDRGAGFYQTERERYHRPALVSTGK